jgi:hypothetical protein
MRKQLHQDQYELANGGKQEKIADLWVGFAQLYSTFKGGIIRSNPLAFPRASEKNAEHVEQSVKGGQAAQGQNCSIRFGPSAASSITVFARLRRSRDA